MSALFSCNGGPVVGNYMNALGSDLILIQERIHSAQT